LPRTIALVASSYHPHVGGVEQHVREVAAELSRRGHRVEVWTVDRGASSRIATVDSTTVRYLPTPLPQGSVLGVARFVAAAPAAFAAWRTARRILQPEVLHVQCFGPNGVYALFLSAMTRTPLVVSSHGETLADDHDVFDRSRQLRLGLRLAIRKAVAVTGCAVGVARDLQVRFGARNVSVVPNGVWPGVSSRVQDTGAEAPRVLVVGRLERVKGFDLVIRALADPRIPVETRLTVVGEGSQAEALRLLAHTVGVQERVQFSGALRADEVRDELVSADVVVVPSRREAFGMVALEAWAAGTALVATSLAGPSEFVRDEEDGLLVDPTDVPSLAHAVARLVNDGDLRRSLTEAGRLRVQEFGWGRVVDRYERLYAGVPVCERQAVVSSPARSATWKQP
jgi:glycogen synthase